MTATPVIYTIGHSTRSIEEFLALLRAHRIERLADIRTVPRSRRHPHFSSDALSASLADAGILYRHFPGLGGLRKPRPDSTNTGWRHEGFRGYADYMQTQAFESALDEWLEWARAPRRRPVLETPERDGASEVNEGEGPRRRPVLDTPERNGARASVPGGGAPGTVIMCAEAMWWRCHRQLVADALLARGVPVRHIISTGTPAPHALTAFARTVDGKVTYPGLL